MRFIVKSLSNPFYSKIIVPCICNCKIIVQSYFKTKLLSDIFLLYNNYSEHFYSKIIVKRKCIFIVKSLLNVFL